ncbi:MAG: T9SS type A sorting domain-containing protein, partial [Ignavibacteriaceae bacterium]
NLGYASEIGDVNNDGYNDFTISSKFADAGFNKGKVFLYYGGATIDTIPVAEFNDPWIQDYFGEDVEAVGDLNKDGYDDFTIGSKYNWTNGLGYLYLIWGGDTITWDSSLTFTSNILGDYFGESAANIGDINNDGFEDLSIGAPFPGELGKIYFYYGGKPMDIEPDTVFIANRIWDGFGKTIKRSGDINNNGTIDFFIGSWDGAYLYLGLDSLITYNGFIYLGTEGDMNNDEFSDFVIGDPNYLNPNDSIIGAAFVYLGNNSVDTNYTYILEGECGSEFSTIVFFADINGDSYDELIVLAPGYPVFETRTGKIYIYSYKKLTDVDNNKENLLNNYTLLQNYPNPFNPNTSIQYVIRSKQFVTLKVYDVLGREIAILVNEEKSAGVYKAEFNASKYKLSSGVYFCELKIKGGNSSRIKMVLIK